MPDSVLRPRRHWEVRPFSRCTNSRPPEHPTVRGKPSVGPPGPLRQAGPRGGPRVVRHLEAVRRRAVEALGHCHQHLGLHQGRHLAVELLLGDAHAGRQLHSAREIRKHCPISANLCTVIIAQSSLSGWP